MNFSRLKPFYCNLIVRNTPTAANYNPYTGANETINAEIRSDYNIPLVDKASDYLLAVERLEVSLNAIPFYDLRDPIDREDIQLQSVATGIIGPGVTLTLTCYSLQGLLTYLSNLNYVNPDPPNNNIRLLFSLEQDGRVTMAIGTAGYHYGHFTVLLPRRLNMILGLSVTQQVPFAYLVYSSFPRVDLGDDLGTIVIQSNLPTVTDSLDNQRSPILTDFGVPSSYGGSFNYTAGNVLAVSSWSLDVRDKYIYAPAEKKYIEMTGDFPINNINIRCYYVTPDGTTKFVPLPIGGAFFIKLGFYLKQ